MKLSDTLYTVKSQIALYIGQTDNWNCTITIDTIVHLIQHSPFTYPAITIPINSKSIGISTLLPCITVAVNLCAYLVVNYYDRFGML